MHFAIFFVKIFKNLLPIHHPEFDFRILKRVQSKNEFFNSASEILIFLIPNLLSNE
jgi:hypothetical protein